MAKKRGRPVKNQAKNKSQGKKAQDNEDSMVLDVVTEVLKIMDSRSKSKGGKNSEKRDEVNMKLKEIQDDALEMKSPPRQDVQKSPIHVIQFGSSQGDLTPVMERNEQVNHAPSPNPNPLIDSIFREEGSRNDEKSEWLEIEGVKVKFDSTIQMEKGEVEKEKLYWRNAVICKVMGANPPLNIFEGFIRRSWISIGIENVSSIGKGLFAVIFFDRDSIDAALNLGMLFFDGKPVISKEWKENMNMDDSSFVKVPVWIRLVGLDFKYWCERSLERIASIVGEFVQIDKPTQLRRNMRFARVLVETYITEDLPEYVGCLDENGGLMKVRLEWEWRPIKCGNCSMLGHGVKECYYNKADDQGFIQVRNKRRLQLTFEQCFERIGYPDWFKGKKGRKMGKMAARVTSCDSSSLGFTTPLANSTVDQSFDPALLNAVCQQVYNMMQGPKSSSTSYPQHTDTFNLAGTRC